MVPGRSLMSKTSGFYQLKQVLIYMGIVTRSIHAAHRYWAALARAYSKLWLDRNLDRPFLVEMKKAPHNWIRMRLRILRRDRYRCRGCDKKAGEVTLRVHQIRPGVSHPDDVLTLCIGCRSLAKNLELKGINIPDFLRHLWRHLHRPVEPNYAQRKILHAGNSRS